MTVTVADGLLHTVGDPADDTNLTVTVDFEPEYRCWEGTTKTYSACTKFSRSC